MPKKSKKKKKNNKIKIFVFIIILLLGVVAGIVYSIINDKLNKMGYMEISTDLKSLNIQESTDKELKDYTNIALLAVDSRDVNKVKGSRSDGIIIISINNKTKDVKLLSVYRDTYVDIDGHGLDKITHAYAFGGPELAIKTLNKNLDLNIKQFVTVNFEIVANIIDLIGGIEIDIKENEISEMNKYIEQTSESTGIKSAPITKAGKQKLDGVQAVTYSRIRKDVGGDYKRNDRMRTVIIETFNKTKKMSISTINEIVDKVLPNVQTNITATQALGMLPQAISYKIVDNTGWPYKTKGITLSAWYGVPVTLESNVKELHEKMFEQSDYEANSIVKEISNKIIQKTGYKS